eukprot:TRINITY_DN60363_c0_g1_i1.p2 TRINITY_DN60363_c0_g1~~TRINITY_DN60363_c0_g1_i1.p2  ORF type:complete len:823 (+),score=358.21 TRINITY_DN60363_c0_g1_i1:147-2471(+)
MAQHVDIHLKVPKESVAELEADVARLRAELQEREKQLLRVKEAGGSAPDASAAAAAGSNGDTCAATLSALSACGIEVRLEEHESVLTVDAWAPFHAKFKTPGSLLTKSLFVKGKKGGLFLVVSLSDTDTNMKTLAGLVGQKEMRFAPDDVLQETLKVPKGSVNPFAVAYDTEKKVTVLLDSRLAASDKLLCFHPMDNTKTVMITNAELGQFFAKIGVEPQVIDFASAPAPAGAPAKAAAKPAGKAGGEKQPKKAPKAAPTGAKTGVSMELRKDDDFAGWYQQVITRSEMIEYYDISGCYILRPQAFLIWKEIQRFFDQEITDMGVEPCYFPMFVSKAALTKEESHVEGFAAEVAWVTKSGDSDLQEHIAIRPTSETVMYPSYAKWIRSHRDLPLRLNQWCNVVRWEFSHPTPFIRTREFLWQEGHTAHADHDSAGPEVYAILELYRRVYEELLAVPVVKGTKTEKEKFAGGHYTTTVEAFIPTVGRSVQGATSHCLGTNFAKMFGIKYEDTQGKINDCWQNSWGLTTRTIGVMVMIHGDDKGLSCPPRVAPLQAVLIPCGITAKTTAEEAAALRGKCVELEQQLRKAGFRAKADVDEKKTPGDKYHHYELRGVPVRIEVGPKDLEKQEVVVCRRHDGRKEPLSLNGFVQNMAGLLETVQKEMFEKACAGRADRTQVLQGDQWERLVPTLNQKKIVLVPFCLDEECETQIKKQSAEESQRIAEMQAGEVDERAPSMGAKSLCIPEAQPEEAVGCKCIRPGCTNAPQKWVLFGRSY